MQSTYSSFRRSWLTGISSLIQATAVCTALALVCGRAWAQIEDEPADNAPDGAPSSQQSIIAKRSPQQVLLAQALPDNAVHWLPQGDREFLALYRSALDTDATGTVLLLHGAGQHPDWPGMLSDLRHYLPTVGWSTVAIALPDPLVPKPPQAKPAQARPPRGEGTSETGDIYEPGTDSVHDGVDDLSNNRPGSDQSGDDRKIALTEPGRAEELAVDRIIAAMNFIRQQGEGPVVIYAQGAGATRAGEYLQEANSNQGIGALVFVDAQNRLPLREFELPQALTNPNLPLLDLLQSSTTSAIADAEARQQQAKRIGAKHYRYTMLAPTGGPGKPNTKLIYGFLKSQLSKR